MKCIYFFLTATFFMLTGSLSACPDCMGKVKQQSPSFFDDDLYSSPSLQKSYQVDPYPYQMLPEQMDPSQMDPYQIDPYEDDNDEEPG